MKAEAHAQAEMLKADSNKLDDIAERPLTPPDGEEEFTDDDGTTNKWDRGLSAWIPQIDYVDFKKHAAGFNLLIRLENNMYSRTSKVMNLTIFLATSGCPIWNEWQEGESTHQLTEKVPMAFCLMVL